MLCAVLQVWNSAHAATPPLDEQYERLYDPAELFPTEGWIARIFEPIREAFFVGHDLQSLQARWLIVGLQNQSQ